MKILRLLAIISLGVAILYPLPVKRKPRAQPQEVPSRLLHQVLPEATFLSSRTHGNSLYYVAHDITGSVSGFLFLAEGRGYGGPIKILVGTDPAGRIKKVVVWEHQETPGYVDQEKLSRFLRQLEGKRIGEIPRLGEGIDAITHATITSSAILQAINKITGEGIIGRRTRGKITIAYETWFLSAFLIFALLSWWWKKSPLRWVVLVVSLGFLGFLKASLLSLPQIANVLTGRLPPLSYNLFWYILFGFILLSTLLVGRLYCGWLCPFGALQELLGRLKVKMGLSSGKERYLRYVKYLLLWGFLFVALMWRNPSLADYEPFATLFTLRGSFLRWLYVGLVLGPAVFFPRLWCRYLCPSGAALASISCLAWRKLQVTRGCQGCRRCVEVCPVGAIEITSEGRARINFPECIQCNRCLEVCPQGAIG